MNCPLTQGGLAIGDSGGGQRSVRPSVGGCGLFWGRKVVPFVFSQSIEHRQGEGLGFGFAHSVSGITFIYQVFQFDKCRFKAFMIQEDKSVLHSDRAVHQTPCFTVFSRPEGECRTKSESVEIQFTSLLWPPLRPFSHYSRMLRAQPSRTSGHFRFPRDKKEGKRAEYRQCRRMGHSKIQISSPYAQMLRPKINRITGQVVVNIN